MKTYITKLFYGSNDKKEEIVKKFNSYKDALEYLNRLCAVFREDGVRFIRCDEHVIDLPKFKVEYRIALDTLKRGALLKNNKNTYSNETDKD